MGTLPDLTKRILTTSRAKWRAGFADLVIRSECGARGSVFPLEERMEWIENQIRSGGMLVYEVFEDGDFIGIFTAMVERGHGKPSNLLVVHAVSAGEQGEPFINTLFPLIHGLVEKSGLASWTVRSQRPGMDRRLEQHGFERVETIYKRRV